MNDANPSNAAVPTSPDSRGSAPGSGSPPEIGVRQAVSLLATLMDLNRAAQRADSESWKLIAALTKDPRHFPKAVLIGAIDTDVATLRIDGVTSKPIEIRTGADGRYEVYGDNYDEWGCPGRIIIEVGHPVTTEAENE